MQGLHPSLITSYMTQGSAIQSFCVSTAQRLCHFPNIGTVHLAYNKLSKNSLITTIIITTTILLLLRPLLHPLPHFFAPKRKEKSTINPELSKSSVQNVIFSESSTVSIRFWLQFGLQESLPQLPNPLFITLYHMSVLQFLHSTYLSLKLSCELNMLSHQHVHFMGEGILSLRGICSSLNPPESRTQSST